MKFFVICKNQKILGKSLGFFFEKNSEKFLSKNLEFKKKYHSFLFDTHLPNHTIFSSQTLNSRIIPIPNSKQFITIIMFMFS